MVSAAPDDAWAWHELTDRSPRGIAAAIARRITTGEMQAGDRLPTVRDVAAAIGVSPGTVSEAWQALRRAGLVDSRGRSGSFVRATRSSWLPPRVAGLLGDAEGQPLDLSRGTPDPGLLPSVEPALGRLRPGASTTVYQDDPVLPELAEALAATWPAPVDRLTVVDGAQEGVSRALQQVVRLGDRVVVESPGYPPVLDVLDVLGVEPVPVLLDAGGVRPDSLREALATRPAAVVIQPRAHNPTGASMAEQRAAELAGVIGEAERRPVIIEDDHSWSISTAPDVSLARFLPEQVVHVRGFSKSHGPELRIAALGGPARIVDQVVAQRMLGPGWTSRLLQAVLVDLLTTERSIGEVAAARAEYAARQGALAAALTRQGVDVGVPDGLNLWLPVADERAAQVRLAAAGIRVAAGAPFLTPGSEERVGPHIRVTAGRVDTAMADRVAAALVAAAG